MGESPLRSRERTSEQLNQALTTLASNGSKLSISAVAAEAGVTPALIHNTYPDIAEKIRAHVGRSTRQQRDEKAASLVEVRQRLKEARAERDAAMADLAKLASINETLRSEVASLKALASGKLAILPRPDRK